MFREWFRYRSLIKNLVYRDLKLKYRGSVLGILWSLLRPLLLMGVYLVAFKYVVRITMDNYVVFLFVGLLPWSFFQGAVLSATESITGNASLIKKINFPRETLPLASVLFHFIQLLLALSVFLPFLLLIGNIDLRWIHLGVFLLLFIHLLFTLGIALLLSALTVSFKDIVHLTDLGLTLLFWVTPIIYPINMVPEKYRFLVKMNPMAAFAIAYQEIMYRGNMPELMVCIIILIWTVSLFGLGYWVFKRFTPIFSELI